MAKSGSLLCLAAEELDGGVLLLLVRLVMERTYHHFFFLSRGVPWTRLESKTLKYDIRWLRLDLLIPSKQDWRRLIVSLEVLDVKLLLCLRRVDLAVHLLGVSVRKLLA